MQTISLLYVESNINSPRLTGGRRSFVANHLMTYVFLYLPGMVNAKSIMRMSKQFVLSDLLEQSLGFLLKRFNTF
jgi:hypothetical protein